MFLLSLSAFPVNALIVAGLVVGLAIWAREPASQRQAEREYMSRTTRQQRREDWARIRVAEKASGLRYG